MKWQFRQTKEEQLTVVLEKAAFDREVEELVSYLESYQPLNQEILPVKTALETVLLKKSELIAVTVEAGSLLLETKTGTYQTIERLSHFQERLNSNDFVQVSKQSLVNIRHIERLEASFSGNMWAKMSEGVTVSVSRRYLKALEGRLGIR